jgi:AcrR family transcriptional regulator
MARAKKYEDQSGHAVRSARTRERVLRTALALFNEMGEQHVTTGHIAEALTMSPGNLYYHFRNKDEIIAGLFAEFKRAIDVDPPREATDGALTGEVTATMEHLWMYLHVMFDCIYEYRFLYFNLTDILGRNPKLREQFSEMVGNKRLTVLALCRGLRASKSMVASDEEIETIADNVLIVATFWLSYHTVRTTSLLGSRGKQSLAQAANRELARGVYQVMATVSPFLQGAAKSQLATLALRYIPADSVE